ncbi:hypothetical protein FKM82_007449 [Ascaphus truei]
MERDKLTAEIRTINKTIGRLSSPCPPNWKLVGFSCYYISGDPKTWEEAENDCIRRSSTLLVLTSSKELVMPFPKKYRKISNYNAPIGGKPLATSQRWPSILI